ncbi:hypothetical protein SAMN05216233_120103 [Desulfoluna spongiiphila]|uniref:Uncharacterized protein n=1 Tax=Desulfoluna spongiiphila TaxID=419481 RepID=A0A1G5ILE3_9BACT|nr:hypothetical protein SAMN05216233_120103 [Desulfoluna spongiiphila]
MGYALLGRILKKQNLFVKLFKSLAPGRAAGGQILNALTLKGICLKQKRAGRERADGAPQVSKRVHAALPERMTVLPVIILARQRELQADAFPLGVDAKDNGIDIIPFGEMAGCLFTVFERTV